MTVPEAVRKQAEEADRQLEEIQKGNGIQDTATQQAAQDVIDPQPAPHVEPDPQPPQSVTVEEYNRVKNELDHANQALRTLQGKYSAEVPRMAEEMRILRTRLDELSQNPPTPAEPGKPGYLRHLKEEEIADLDKNVLDMQGRLAKGAAESEVAQVRRETQRLKEDLGAQVQELKRTVTEAKTRTVWAEIEKVHPGASQMDTQGDPKWLAFLESFDDLTGVKHLDIGAKALAQGDSNRVIKLIDKFKAAGGTPSVDPVIAGQVKPRTTRVESGTRPSQKSVYKESEMNSLVREITQGLWKNRKKEAEEKMNQFEDAVMEGRILFGQ